MDDRISPLGVLTRGLLAGAIASYVQNRFFTLTSRWAPSPPKGAFEPPEAEQQSESTTETVARRTAEGLAKRPLSPALKSELGSAVHYGYGAMWGALYGTLGESVRPLLGIGGGLVFGGAVWAASDLALLPAFNLAGPAERYPAESHAYALTAHAVYGGALAVSYRLLRSLPGAAAAVGLLAVDGLLLSRLTRVVEEEEAWQAPPAEPPPRAESFA